MAYYYFDSHGVNPEIIQRGLEGLIEMCNEVDRDGIIAITLKDNLKTAFQGILQPEVINGLRRNEQVVCLNRVFYLLTNKISGVGNHHNGPALVIYPKTELLDKIDTYTHITDVLVIPWLTDEIRNWIQLHNAQRVN